MRDNFVKEEKAEYTTPVIRITYTEWVDIVTLSNGGTGDPMGSEDFNNLFGM